MLPRLFGMRYVLQKPAGEGGEGGTGGGGAGAGAGGQGTAGAGAAGGGQQGGAVDDKNPLFKDAYNSGFNAALKFLESYVKPGQLTPEQVQAEIQRLAAEKKKPQYQQQDAETLEKLKQLETENTTLKQQFTQAQVRGAFTQELHAAGVIDAEDTLLAIEARYELRNVNGQQLIFKKGATIPETMNGKEATIRDFVLKYKTEKPHQFRTGGKGLETDISSGADFNVTDDQLRDPNFVKALKATGQWDNVFQKKPVDLKSIRSYMDTMR